MSDNHSPIQLKVFVLQVLLKLTKLNLKNLNHKMQPPEDIKTNIQYATIPADPLW